MWKKNMAIVTMEIKLKIEQKFSSVTSANSVIKMKPLLKKLKSAEKSLGNQMVKMSLRMENSAQGSCFI